MIKVTKQDANGRNERFLDTKKKEEMTRSQFVKEIENGSYDKFHIRKINGIKTPVSNPDKKKKNNLG